MCNTVKYKWGFSKLPKSQIKWKRSTSFHLCSIRCILYLLRRFPSIFHSQVCRPIHFIEKNIFLLIFYFQRIVCMDLLLKQCQIIRCPFLIEKGAVLNYIYESLDEKFTTNLFPTTKLIQNQDSLSRKSAVFINNETLYFRNVFKTWFLLLLTFLKVHLKTSLCYTLRAAPWFSVTSFFCVHQRVLPSLLQSISHRCIDISPRHCTHGITEWFCAYRYKIYII